MKQCVHDGTGTCAVQGHDISGDGLWADVSSLAKELEAQLRTSQK